MSGLYRLGKSPSFRFPGSSHDAAPLVYLFVLDAAFNPYIPTRRICPYFTNVPYFTFSSVGLGQNITQPSKKIIPVQVREKNCYPSDSSPDDMVKSTCGIYPRPTRHGNPLNHDFEAINLFPYVPYFTQTETPCSVFFHSINLCSRSAFLFCSSFNFFLRSAISLLIFLNSVSALTLSK